MSLFTICSWWSAQCPDFEENYGLSCLLCSRFGIESGNKEYVVVGSRSGLLCIFYPSLDGKKPMNRKMKNETSSTKDLLLELQLDAPIITLFSGCLSGGSHSNSIQLGVLLPNCIRIYEVGKMDSRINDLNVLQLNVLAEYWFSRVAIDCCKGHFGRVKGREFFCVVHLDGMLTFYEQDGITYQCTFQEPSSSIAYCERTDSFVRFSNSWNLECYTYQDLSQSPMNNSPIYPVWSLSLGEAVLEMDVIRAKNSYSLIVLLGELNFFIVRDNGNVNYILKLHYIPKCFHSYMLRSYWEPNAALITLIISNTGNLFIYQAANIMWGAQYQNVRPVAISLANVDGLPGVLVSLGSRGQLHIDYLGSEPFIFEMPKINSNAIGFGEAYVELLQLEKEIKNTVDQRNMLLNNERAINDFSINFDMNQETMENDDILYDVAADVAVKELVSCGALLEINNHIDLSELQLTINIPNGLRCSQDTISYLDMERGCKEKHLLAFYIIELLHIPTTRVDLIASFINNRGIPRVLKRSAYLPLNMFYAVVAPQTAASMKFVFHTDAENLAPKLSTFFPEFSSSLAENSALGLQFLCSKESNEVVTIIAAKNSNRIRIHSECLEVFALIFERLSMMACRLQFGNTISESLVQSNSKNTSKLIGFPFWASKQIVRLVDVHNETQESIRTQTKQLNNLWQEFRTLQGQLQNCDLNTRETIVMQMEELYDHLIVIGDKVTDITSDGQRERCNINCAIKMATIIISHMDLNSEIKKLVLSVLMLPIEDWKEISWVQSVSPGIEMLHQYSELNKSTNSIGGLQFIKNSKEIMQNIPENYDYVQFSKHFQLMLDRLKQFAIEKENSTSKQMELVTGSTSHSLSKPIDFSSSQERKDSSNPNVENNVDSKTLMCINKESQVPSKSIEVIVQNTQNTTDTDIKNVSIEDCEWINDEFNVPTTEELFTDLGVWW